MLFFCFGSAQAELIFLKKISNNALFEADPADNGDLVA